MNVRLVKFRYYFAMKDQDRNLHSITWEFRPVVREGADEAAVKACGQALVQAYTEKLERVCQDLIKGTRQPFMNDFAHEVRVGYEYEGHVRKVPGAVFNRRARALFAGQALRDPCKPSMYSTLRASIECTSEKQGGQTRGGDITVSLRLGHMLNLCFFEFTKGLEGLEVAPGARESIESLEHTLTMTAGQGEADYVRLFTQ